MNISDERVAQISALIMPECQEFVLTMYYGTLLFHCTRSCTSTDSLFMSLAGCMICVLEMCQVTMTDLTRYTLAAVDGWSLRTPPTLNLPCGHVGLAAY